MALASLRYRPNAVAPEETRTGYVIYSGGVLDYQHWKFRTEMKLFAANNAEKPDNEYPRTAASIV